MYEVQRLDYSQAIQLFSLYAFKKDEPDESYVQLTNRIIGYADGLPLALGVLGSHLHGKSVQEWKSALKKYERSLPKDIYEKLKISYDGLEDNEKNIFLDIACFFKGRNLSEVKEILDHCGFSSAIGIACLRDKCLIDSGKDFDNNKTLEMHDLLQEMGKEIVRQESPKEAGERSRLWYYEDVLCVLQENTGTNKVEAILLDFPEGHEKIRLHSKAFKKMKNLRMLIIRNAEFSTGPTYLSNEIRVFDWRNYPSPILPPNFYGNKLTMFRITGGLIQELGGLKAKNMTTMELDGCKFLTRIPDLSSCINLQYLYLEECENLVEIHHSVGFLDKLLKFFAVGCCKLRIFPKILKLRSLMELSLICCDSLKYLPETIGNLTQLSKLHLAYTGIKELPSSIGNLTQLSVLILYGNLKGLPSSIENLTQLYYLTLSGTGIKELPSSIENLTQLGSLSLRGTNIKELPSSIENFTQLSLLDLKNTDIKELPSSILNLTQLSYLDLSETDIKGLPSSIGNLTRLRSLSLSKSSIIELPSSIGNLTLLERICATYCKNLVHLPSSVFRLQSLRDVALNGCSQPINIGKVEEDGTLSTASVVPTGECEIASTSELTPIKSSISNYGRLFCNALSLEFCCLSKSNFFVNNYFPNLGTLDLSGSDIVVFPQSSVRFDMLTYLYLNNCKQLKEIRPLPSCIEVVQAHGCTSLESFAEISEIVFKNNGTWWSNEGIRSVDLYGCYKLGVDMGLPSREQRGSMEQNWIHDKYIIYPGERIPGWFSYSKEVHDHKNLCEIDINGAAQQWDDIDKIFLCFVFGLRVGINPEMKEATIEVHIKSRCHRRIVSTMEVNRMDSDHVWMGYCRPDSRFEVRWMKYDAVGGSDDVVIRSVGVHFLMKHEENARDHPSVDIVIGVDEDENSRSDPVEGSDDVVIRSVGVHFLMKHEENARDHPSVDIAIGVDERLKIIYDEENFDSDDENLKMCSYHCDAHQMQTE